MRKVDRYLGCRSESDLNRIPLGRWENRSSCRSRCRRPLAVTRMPCGSVGAGGTCDPQSRSVETPWSPRRNVVERLARPLALDARATASQPRVTFGIFRSTASRKLGETGPLRRGPQRYPGVATVGRSGITEKQLPLLGSVWRLVRGLQRNVVGGRNTPHRVLSSARE
jgi:hypothetical protein